jgi:hypothetical protein
MEQKDYLLREISKIGDMLRYFVKKLVEQKEEKEEIEFTEQLDADLFNELNLGMDDFLQLPKEELFILIEQRKGFNAENIETLGDLLVHLSDRDIENRIKYLKQALNLYEYIDKNSNTFSMILSDKMTKTTNKINEV